MTFLNDKILCQDDGSASAPTKPNPEDMELSFMGGLDKILSGIEIGDDDETSSSSNSSDSTEASTTATRLLGTAKTFFAVDANRTDTETTKQAFRTLIERARHASAYDGNVRETQSFAQFASVLLRKAQAVDQSLDKSVAHIKSAPKTVDIASLWYYL